VLSRSESKGIDPGYTICLFILHPIKNRSKAAGC
jgi:hypothetical protein